MEISQNFVAFSEYMNFMKFRWPDEKFTGGIEKIDTGILGRDFFNMDLYAPHTPHSVMLQKQMRRKPSGVVDHDLASIE